MEMCGEGIKNVNGRVGEGKGINNLKICGKKGKREMWKEGVQQMQHGWGQGPGRVK